MPPKTDVLAQTKAIVDTQTYSIVLKRILDGPREQVFEAWTRPEHVRCWWDPSGKPLKSCEIDLRPGGAFRFVADGVNNAPPFSGVYREIVPPERLVFEALGALGSVILAEAGDRTELTVTIRCSSEAHLAQFLAIGIDAGTAQTLDNLAAYVGRTG